MKTFTQFLQEKIVDKRKSSANGGETWYEVEFPSANTVHTVSATVKADRFSSTVADSLIDYWLKGKALPNTITVKTSDFSLKPQTFKIRSGDKDFQVVIETRPPIKRGYPDSLFITVNRLD